MKVKTKDVGFTQYILDNGGKLLEKNRQNEYIIESDTKRHDWRLAYLNTTLPQYNAGIVLLLNLNK